MILLIILHMLFSLTFPLTKIALKNSTPLFFTSIRMVLGGFLIAAYYYFKDRSIFKSILRDSLNYIYYVIMLAIFNVFLSNAAESFALIYLTSAEACFIYSITPFITALLSYFLFSEYITKTKLFGMIIGTAGFLFMIVSKEQIKTENIFFISYSEILMIFASFATSYGWIIMRQLVDKLDLNYKSKTFSDSLLIFSNSASMILGGLISLFFSLILEDKSKLFNFNQEFILAVFSMVFVSNIVAYNLYAYLLKKYSATLLSFSGFIEPIFAAFYDYLIFNQTVSINFFISSLIIIIGLYIFYSNDLKKSSL